MVRKGGPDPFQIQDIAKQQGIPAKFLEQIMLLLKKGGILASKRGVGGGYRLARSPDRINLAEIIALVEGPNEEIPCSRPGQSTCACGIPAGCGLGFFFHDLEEETTRRLHATSLADILSLERGRSQLHFDI
jgi:Rrf2 family protein